MSECVQMANICVTCDELWPCRARLTADLAAARAEAEAFRDALNELTDASEALGEMVAADPDAMRRTGQPNLGITSRLVVATMDARAILARRPERREGADDE